jgi:hypothetical protein
MSVRILVLGRELRALESVSVVGDVLGLSRSTAFRLAESDNWPIVGRSGARRVIVPALATQLSLPWTALPEDGAADEHC